MYPRVSLKEFTLSSPPRPIAPCHFCLHCMRYITEMASFLSWCRAVGTQRISTEDVGWSSRMQTSLEVLLDSTQHPYHMSKSSDDTMTGTFVTQRKYRTRKLFTVWLWFPASYTVTSLSDLILSMLYRHLCVCEWVSERANSCVLFWMCLLQISPL